MLQQYRGLRRELYVLAFGRLVTGLGSMVWPMMTLILSQKMGVSAGNISILLSIAMIIMAPAVYLGGRIADKRDKKMTIVYLDIISVACFIICAFIPLSWVSIGFMFIGSLGQNMEQPAYSALVADITLTADRDRAYSLQYLCANLGLVLAPTLAGFLFTHYLWLVFFINGTSIASSAALIFFLVKDTSAVTETASGTEYQIARSGENVMKILRENRVVVLFILVMSGYFAVYQMYGYLMPLDLAAIHGDRGALIYGSVTSVNCVVVVLATPIVTRLFGTKPEPGRITAGVALLVAGFGMFFAFEGIVPLYYISMTILTIGEVFSVTAENPYLSRRVPSSHRGRVNGVFTVIRTTLTSLFQVGIGVIYESGGAVPAWTAVIAAGAGFVVLSLVLCRTDRKTYSNLY